jgi:hypothetical protein
MMQQILAAHDIPSRIVNQGVAPHFGCGIPALLEVRQRDRWTALLLLSPLDDEAAQDPA